jgi:hypothetical protein
VKGYKERGRSRGEATNGCERVKGWEERIFAVLILWWVGGRFRAEATVFLRPDEKALKKVKFKGGDPG